MILPTTKNLNKIKIMSFLFMNLLSIVPLSAPDNDTSIKAKQELFEILQTEMKLISHEPLEYTSVHDFNFNPYALYMLATRALEVRLEEPIKKQQQLLATDLDLKFRFCKTLMNIYNQHMQNLKLQTLKRTIPTNQLAREDLSTLVDQTDTQKNLDRLNDRLKRLDHCLKIRIEHFRSKQQDHKK